MTDSLKVAQQEGRAPWTEVEIDTREFIVYRDIYPVTPGHTLVVPKENTQENILKCFKFAMEMGSMNIEADNDITGYNVGINMGESAGQTCFYPHVHLIFRRDGDMEDPAGGVRGVIPSKQKYTKKETNQTDMFEEQ
jgi:diadenosine tetraphosphate (Ap4A) HIT family hydrolase